jgi:hypothetical protein
MQIGSSSLKLFDGDAAKVGCQQDHESNAQSRQAVLRHILCTANGPFGHLVERVLFVAMWKYSFLVDSVHEILYVIAREEWQTTLSWLVDPSLIWQKSIRIRTGVLDSLH